MLLAHSLLYLLGRGLPGLINLFAIGVYTRLLLPAEYGRYVMVMASVLLLGTVVFQWLRLGLLRYLPAYLARREEFLSTVVAIYLGLTLLTGIIGAAVWLFCPSPNLRPLILLALLLLWADSWFELNQELNRVRLAPLRNGLLGLAKALCGLGVAWGLAYAGFGTRGLLLGMLCGILVPIGFSWREWRGVRRRLVNTAVIRQLLAYGLPLTMNFALGYVVSTSDRLLLGWLRGPSAAAVYAVGYDLTQQSIALLMLVINLAAYPIVVHALEEGRHDDARAHLSENFSALLAIALPATIGLALLSQNVAGALLGHSFRQDAVAVIPWIAFGTLLFGFKVYYFDLSFQLGQRTIGQIWVSMVAAVTNVGLNLWLIPRHGPTGAAVATLLSFAMALLMSGLLGHKILALPIPRKEPLKILGATLGMVMAVWPCLRFHGTLALGVQVLVCLVSYALLLLLLDILGCRGRMRRMVHRMVVRVKPAKASLFDQV